MVCRSPAHLLTSGELNRTEMASLPSLVTPSTFQFPISLTDVHTTNPVLEIKSWCGSLTSPRMNGESSLCQRLQACQSKSILSRLIFSSWFSLSDCRIQVNGSDLGIGVSPLPIYPPIVSSSFIHERMINNPLILWSLNSRLRVSWDGSSNLYARSEKSYIKFWSYELRQRKMRFDKVVIYFESMTTDPWHIRVPFQRVSSVSQGSVPSHWHRIMKSWKLQSESHASGWCGTTGNFRMLLFSTQNRSRNPHPCKVRGSCTKDDN